MWPKPQPLANLVTFTEEILNGKLAFCKVLNSRGVFKTQSNIQDEASTFNINSNI